MKILIADDHALFRDGLKLTLEQLDSGAQILQAESYETAEKLLDSKPQPNLLIIDLDMPDQSWQEGLDMLKNKAPEAHIVVMSAIEDTKIKEGDKVFVKYLGADKRGKTRMSMVGIDQKTGKEIKK